MDSIIVYLSIAIFLGIISFLQRHIDFYSHLKDALTFKIVSLFLLIGAVAEFSLSIEFNWNPFLIRIAGAHFLTFALLIGIILVVGYNDLIKGILFAGTFTAFHELIWTAGFFVAGTPLSGTIPTSFILVYYEAFVVLLLCITTSFIVFFGLASLKAFLKAAIIMVIFTTVWLLLGFHASTSLIGHTVYYSDFMVNLTEGLSWLLPGGWFIVEYLMTKRLPKGVPRGIFD